MSQDLAHLLNLFESGETTPTPAVPTPAAAVVCVRDTPGGIQVFVTRQADAPGLTEKNRWAFPIAELHPDDIHHLPLAVWDAQKCARMLRMDNSTKALNYFATAARAALELLGVLLAEDVDGRIISSTDTPLWEESRRKLVTGKKNLGQLMSERDLKVRLDLLSPWMRWVNTRWQLRRHDVIYFICAVPHGQTVSFRSANESWGGWMTPAAVLESAGQAGAGKLAASQAGKGQAGKGQAGVEQGDADYISASTRLVCESLAETPTVGSAMARVRDVSPILPEIVRHDDQWWVSLSDRADPSERGQVRDVEKIVAESDLEYSVGLLSSED